MHYPKKIKLIHLLVTLSLLVFGHFFMHAGTKQILLINLDQSGGPDIILEKSKYLSGLKTINTPTLMIRKNYWTYGSIHLSAFLSSDILTSITRT